MYNKVIMLGRITQDLELKTTPNGVSVLSFGIAVDRKFQTKGEERKVDFFNCVAWINEAEFISKYWSKGRPILIEGELQNRSYVDKNGVTRHVSEIVVDHATFTGDGKPRDISGTPPAANEQRGNDNAANSQREFTKKDVIVTETEDEYPF